MNHNSKILIQENAIENVVDQMSTILSRASDMSELTHIDTNTHLEEKGKWRCLTRKRSSDVFALSGQRAPRTDVMGGMRLNLFVFGFIVIVLAFYVADGVFLTELYCPFSQSISV